MDLTLLLFLLPLQAAEQAAVAAAVRRSLDLFSRRLMPQCMTRRRPLADPLLSLPSLSGQNRRRRQASHH